MVKKPMTPRQLRERAAWAAEKEAAAVKPVKPVETAADRRNYLRKKAGWPVKDYTRVASTRENP